MALRIIFRFARPYIMQFVMRKLEQKVNSSMGFSPPPEQEKPRNHKEGKITIDKMPESKKQKGDTSNLGEYVEYEEIE